MRTRIFLSAVSGQFKDCRDALASDLRAVGCEVKVQEDFQQGPRTLIEHLEEYIAQCDRVIALVGDAYGFEASGVAVPAVTPPRSYTQWEYFFTLGERLDGSRAPRKDLYLYFASDQFLREHSVEQPAGRAERQRRFCEEVLATGEHWASFDSVDHLCRLVLRDGWQMTERPRKPRNLPYDSIGTLFKGRGTFLHDLHDRLQREPTRAAAIVCKQAIHGLGGVGKSRLAVEYGLQYQAEYSALLFVVADTPQSLYHNLASLCGPLVLNLPEQDAKEQDTQIAAALRWLHEHPGWFFILDNVDTPAAAAEVERLLAQLRDGHVLITSRISDWSRGVEPLELDVLSADDSVAFLLEKTEGRRRVTATDVDDARALAQELDGLALALEQAGAFISKLRVSLADYLRRWREREVKVRTWHDETLMKYPSSVAVTWDTTVAQLDSPAHALLQILSWFAPEPIPRAVLETDVAKHALSSGADLLRDSGEVLHADPVPADMEEALAALAGFSLLKWESGNAAFRIHRLVQEVTREWLSAEQRAFWVRAALTLLDDYLPGDPPPYDVRSWPRWEPLRPHIAAAVALADQARIAEPTTRLMDGLGLLLWARALHDEAEPLLRRALTIDEQSFGPVHPNVARDLIDLALVLHDTNRMEEAEPLYERGLTIDERSFGPDHPEVATDLRCLAGLLRDTNRLAEAEPLYRRALAINEQIYGPDHPKVASDLADLAGLLQDTNRLADAEALHRRALTIDEKSYGPDHPEVAHDLHSLASLLQDTNRMAEAEPLLRRALAIDEKSYGPDHPEVARDLHNLASLLQDTNPLAEVEPLLRRALIIDEKSYGADHPAVARDLYSLASLLQDTNRLTEAEPLYRRALAIDEKSYGPDHPEVAKDLNNLADLLHDAKRLAEAEPLVRRALAIDERSYGPNHPDVATDLLTLAELLQAAGRLAEAEPLMRRALTIDENSHGPNHPDVARDLKDLASLLQETNRLAEAEPLMRRSLVIFKRSLGPEHPNTTVVAGNYRLLLQASGLDDTDIERRLEAVQAEAAPK